MLPLDSLLYMSITDSHTQGLMTHGIIMSAVPLIELSVPPASKTLDSWDHFSRSHHWVCSVPDSIWLNKYLLSHGYMSCAQKNVTKWVVVAIFNPFNLKQMSDFHWVPASFHFKYREQI